MNKKIYIAGKITGECETKNLMIKCKEKFYSYSHRNNSVESEYRPSVVFYLGKDDLWYTHGLFINRTILGTGSWQDYMRNDLSILLRCDEIHMLPDWQSSKGAKIEHQLALDLGIKIVYVDESTNPNLPKENGTESFGGC